MSKKRKQNGAILAKFSIGRYDDDETRRIQTKTPKWIHPLSNQLCNRIANVSVKILYEESSTQNLVQIWKNSIQKLMKLYSPRHWTKKELYTFSFIYVRTTIWAPGPRLAWIPKTSIFVSSSQIRNTSGTSRATNEQLEFLAPLIILKSEYCGKRSRISKNKKNK